MQKQSTGATIIMYMEDGKAGVGRRAADAGAIMDMGGQRVAGIRRHDWGASLLDGIDPEGIMQA